MPLKIVNSDITTMHVDAIVNAANTALQQGGGVCGAIFRAAGAEKLRAACSKLAPIKTGEAVITPGFDLPAKYVIHTPGPVYRDGKHGEREMLRSCYLNSLKLAKENKCKSVAFPLISSGIYGYPKAEALKAATSAIKEFLAGHDLDVYLAVFDKESFAVSEKLRGEVASYIDEHYVRTHLVSRRRPEKAELETLDEARVMKYNVPSRTAEEPSIQSDAGLEALIGNLDEPFSATLLRLIDAKGKTDVEVYKRANIDRKLFSKIRSGKGYRPGKRTAIALAVALELTLEETEDLLRRAGYALSTARFSTSSSNTS